MRRWGLPADEALLTMGPELAAASRGVPVALWRSLARGGLCIPTLESTCTCRVPSPPTSLKSHREAARRTRLQTASAPHLLLPRVSRPVQGRRQQGPSCTESPRSTHSSLHRQPAKERPHPQKERTQLQSDSKSCRSRRFLLKLPKKMLREPDTTGIPACITLPP